MITELTYNDLETIQGGVSCIMPRTNNKAGGSYDPFIDGRVSVSYTHLTLPTN